jgi:peptidoglycan/xylan/chitin deacetylase (PgdA/CDA1 family)/SAM-dependent methyltransferase
MLIFRFDDYSAAERIKVEVDERIFRTFRTHGVPLTVAVTPRMVSDVHDATCESYSDLGSDPRRIDLLNKGLDAGWELAQHGLTHRRSVVRDYTEFAMLSRAIQVARIREGRERLSEWFPGSPLRVFVPPWNSFDSITVEAAAVNSFEVLCAGPGSKAAVRSGVRIIPSVMSIEELLSFCEVFSLPRLLADLAGTSLVVTLHEYEFRQNDQPDRTRLDALEATISAIASSQIPCGTLGPADPEEFDISNHGELEAALVFLRRLRGPQRSYLTSAVGGLAKGSRKNTIQQGLHLGAFIADQLGKARRSVRDRSQPAWRSILRARALVAGRLRPGPQRSCPVCGYVGVFERIGTRPNGLCPGCGSLERHRFIVSTVGPAIGRRARNRRALILAPDPLLGMLRSAFETVVTADIARDDVDLKFDLQKLPFKSGAFDLILATHVLDEIEDDRAALRECQRCLSEGGWLIAPVPILAGETTIELDERRSDGKIRLAGRDYLAQIAADGFVPVETFEPLDPSFASLDELRNIRTPNCIMGTEGVVVFEKRST